jgi:PKD-like domain/MBG domain (YGX type)
MIKKYANKLSLVKKAIFIRLFGVVAYLFCNAKSTLLLTFFVVGFSFNGFAATPTVSGVAVNAQTGALTYGTGGSATYNVTLSWSACWCTDGSSTQSLAFGGGTPAGVTWAFTNPAAGAMNISLLGDGATDNVHTLTISTTSATPAGAYAFTITTSNGGRTANGTLTVSPKALTITASNVAKTYGDAIASPGAGQTTFTSSGLVGAETIGSVSIAYGTGTAATAAVGSNATVTPSAATGGTFTASNYTITYAVGNIVISARALTVTANAQNKTYGTTQATPSAGSTAFTSSGLQNGETIGSVTLAYAAGGIAAGNAVGSTSTITPSAATGGTFTSSNYTITYATGTLTVTTAALTVTASAQSKTYGTTQATPAAGSTAFTSSGLQNGETIGSVTLTYGAGGIAATNAVGSTSTITPSVATGGTFTASNYSISYVAGTLTVTAAALTITADNVNKTYGAAIASPGAGQTTFTSSGLQNGETIGTVSIAYGVGTAATAAVGTYNTVTPSAATGGTFTSSNYTITYALGNIVIAARALTITANAQNKTYGTTQATPVAGSTAFTSSGLQNAETIGSVTLTYGAGGIAATNVVGSTSTITPSSATGGTFTAGNYTITYVAGTLTVTVAALTITASSQSKCQGATLTFAGTEFTTSGLLNSDAITGVTLTSTGAASGAANGAFSIVPSAATGTGVSNYTITYTNGTLTVASPTTQATVFSASSITATSMTLSWVRGNGTGGVLITALAGSAPADPSAGVTYSANAAYGTGGTQVNGSGYAVYDGALATVNLTGLSAGTTYYFAAYDYNTGHCYNLTELTGNYCTTPATPGAITGGTLVCPSTAGQAISIAAVTGATSYTWTAPAGWSITAGQGTVSATVTSGTLVQTGNITVTATCGTTTSAASSQAVSFKALPAQPSTMHSD